MNIYTHHVVQDGSTWKVARVVMITTGSMGLLHVVPGYDFEAFPAALAKARELDKALDPEQRIAQP